MVYAEEMGSGAAGAEGGAGGMSGATIQDILPIQM